MRQRREAEAVETYRAYRTKCGVREAIQRTAEKLGMTEDEVATIIGFARGEF